MARGRKIDYKTWTNLVVGNATVSTNTTTILGNGVSSSLQSTILRCRMSDCLVHLDATKQVGDLMVLTFGLGIVSSDAFAAGAASVPDPFDEPEYPWLWWGSYTVEAELAAAEESLGASCFRFSADSKSMRRFQPGSTLGWFMQTTSASGAPATKVRMGSTRVLIGT